MDVFSKSGQLPKKHHRCISLESGQNMTKKSYPKTPSDAWPRFFPRRYSTPELAMRKHALLKYGRDNGDDGNSQPISNKSCQTDILGLDKYLQRFPVTDANSAGSAAALKASSYKRPSKKPKVRSVAVHCERRRMTFAAFKGGQKFKHVYKRKISLPQPSTSTSPPTTPSTATARATPADDCRRDSGMLPKLRPDRTGIADRPVAACSNKAAAGPVVKLPRIPTRDQRLELDRPTDDRGGTRRLARLTRPLSTGSGSGSGSSGNKLAYFRARSAPKIDSRYRTLIATERSPPPDNELSSSSSDTVNTALDVSFIRKQPDDSMVGDASNSRTGDCGTRTVSTSTTFVEPVFPIVFSCESVLRHPLDGGYVSHTESHRFSVHYVPNAEADNTDVGSQSSLVFTSAGACHKEQCLTGDSMSVTLRGGKPVTVVDNSTTVAAVDERFETRPPSADRSHGSHPVGDVRMTNPNDFTETTMTPPENDNHHRDKVIRTDGFYVLGKGDPQHKKVNTFDTVTVAVPSMSPDKTIDTFVGEFGYAKVEREEEDKTATGVEEKKEEKDTVSAAALGSHAHAGGTPLLQPDDEQNYERLTQNLQQTHANRTVTDQSPKPDGTASPSPDATHRHNDPKPVKDGTHANGLHIVPTELSVNDKLTERSVNDKPTERSANVESINVTTDVQDDNPTRIRIDNNNHCLTVPLELQPYENTDMASHRHRKHRCESMTKHEVERLPLDLTSRTQFCKQTDSRSMQCDDPRHCEPVTDRRRFEHIGNSKRNFPPGRIRDNVSRTQGGCQDGGLILNRDPYQVHVSYSGTTTHPNTFNRHRETTDGRSEHTNGRHAGTRDSDPIQADAITNGTTHRKHFEGNHNYRGRFTTGRDEKDDKPVTGQQTVDYDSIRLHGQEDPGSRVNALHVRGDGDNTNTCRRCTGSLLHVANGMKNGTKSRYDTKAVDDLDYYGHTFNNGKNLHNPMSKSKLESVDETAESKESNYIGGFLFGDVCYKKRPQKYEADNERDGRAEYVDEYYDDSKKDGNFTSKPNHHYGYYGEYVPKTGHSARDEDCTVFADAPRNPSDNRGTDGVPHDQRYSTVAAAPAHTSYYSQLNKSKAAVQAYGDEDKNSDSDDSLTDSLEDGCKYDGAAVSYFLALDGNQKSAVTFTLKMPNTLESRLNRRQSRLKKHLHVSTTVRKTPVRVRTRHKGCQTLWTEEKGVQVQRGSTATAARKAASLDDRKVLETLLAGLERNRVSENQIRVVGGQKMVSEGNQTERPSLPSSDRHIQTQTRTTMLREAAVGPGTPENNVAATSGPNFSKGTQLPPHGVKQFSSDNALMVGVVRQNKYKGKEALLDGAKNDQHLTLSKGWINFYTLRADSADTDAQDLQDNDEEFKAEDDSQQYTVHVQAIPEPVTLPAVHVPNRSTLLLSKICSASKHLPKLVQTETNNHHCPSHLATVNGWCVSVDGPNNMHMKVSLLPDKSDTKTSEQHFDPNEENKHEARRLALQKKNNNHLRRPYRNIKRTQSTPRDMFSADVSRTESALSAESKYIETIDTQLLIHKARRRLSQEWDSRIKNRGVTESVQLVVTGDSVSSRTSQHYATRGHQPCSFRQQSRRI